MKTLDQIVAKYSSKSTELKADWYSRSAESYDNGRPYYPSSVISKVISETAITASSKLLEIGSGPGTATRSFAELGCTIDCVEPNPHFVEIARRRFNKYPNIKIHQSAFEEYSHGSALVDVVLAASSFHWIKREVAFAKSAALLKPSGFLVLLWNKELQPFEKAGESIREVFEDFAPGLFPFEGEIKQVQILESFSKWFIESEYFSQPHFEFCVSSVRYSAHRYIDALQSYSPLLQLDDKVKNGLFQALLKLIETNYGGVIDLKYLTGYHLARKA